MERNQFWIFTGIAFAIVFATAFMLRDNPSVAGKLGNMAVRFEALEVTGLVSGIDAHVGRIIGATRTKKIAGKDAMSEKVEGALARIRSGSTESTPLFQPLKKAGDTAKVAAAKVAAAKKAAALKKKKSKKKTKKVGGPAGTKTDEETESADDSEVEVAKGARPATEEIAAATAAPEAEQTAKEAEQIPQTLAEWTNLVLREPDYKNTEKLVKYYQSKMVKANVFYAITDKMLEDPRPKMQQLGVMALTATPSTQSFESLAEYIHSDSGDTAIKTQASVSLKRYATTYPQVIAMVLSSSQSQASAIEAHKMLRLALESALKPAQDSTGTNPTQASLAQVEYYRRTFLPLLLRLETTYQDAELKSELDQTMLVFNQLVPTDGMNLPTSTASN